MVMKYLFPLSPKPSSMSGGPHIEALDLEGNFLEPPFVPYARVILWGP